VVNRWCILGSTVRGWPSTETDQQEIDMSNQITPQKFIAVAGIIGWIIGTQIGDYQIVDFAKDAVFVGVGIEVSMWIIDKVFGK
jgi:hypothetical protein